MENNTNAQPQSRFVPQFEICPLCGENSKNRRYLVCKACDDRYHAYATDIAAQLLAGKNTGSLTKQEWVYEQLDLPRIEKLLADAQIEVSLMNIRISRLNERVQNRVNETTSGKDRSPEIVEEVRKQARENFLKEDAETRNKHVFNVRRFNAWLKAAQMLKADIEESIAQKKAAAAAKVPAPTPPIPTVPTTALLTTVAETPTASADPAATPIAQTAVPTLEPVTS